MRNKLLIMVCLMATFLMGCDKGPIKPLANPYAFFAGTWYEEVENEEITFTESGYLYDRYCTFKRAYETEGRYEVTEDLNKITYTYPFNGSYLYHNFYVTETTDLSCRYYDEVSANIVLRRVVETYQMSVGDTEQIQFSASFPLHKVVSYKSLNEYIANVDSNGVITATGEKGTTYIKIQTQTDAAWVKVVVGEDCLDLWCDMVSFIGKSYDYVVSVLGQPSMGGEDGHTFGYDLAIHELFDNVAFFMDPQTSLVEEIACLCHKGSVEAQILSYMKSKYYLSDEFGDGGNYFTSGPNLDESRAIVSFNPDDPSVRFFDPKCVELIPDYVHTLGMTLNELQTHYNNYVPDISGLYITNNEFVYGIRWIFDEETSVVTGYGLFVNEGADYDLITAYLASKYYVLNVTDTEIWFVNSEALEDSTLLVDLNLENGVILYLDITGKFSNTKSPATDRLMHLCQRNLANIR